MKTHYDIKADAFYLRFSDSPIIETREVADGVHIDFDADGKIVGFEFLDTRARLSPGSKFSN